MRDFYLQAIFENDLIDQAELWQRMSPFQQSGRRINYGRQDNHYILYYTGDSQSGLKILETISHMSGDIKIYVEFRDDFSNNHSQIQPKANRESQIEQPPRQQKITHKLKLSPRLIRKVKSFCVNFFHTWIGKN